MEGRKPFLYEAIITFVSLIVVMAVGIAVYGANPHIPMLIGTAFAAMMALRLGYKWQTIEKSMFDGISQALQAVVILAIIGVLIGVWLLAGVVPTMIYYGLGVMTPNIFLLATMVICSVTSLATGTSWGTAGTMGIAMIGIGQGLGIPAPMTAGAIISGAYFGDKMSPLSDTTNLAPAMAGTDVFTHIKFMVKPTLVAYAIAAVFYLVLGMKLGNGGADMTSIETMRASLAGTFKISPFLLLPPIVVIVAIARKVPAIPGIFLGIVLGAILAPIFQGSSFGDILNVSYSGFESKTGIEAVDKLLSAGGLSKMMYSISLTLIAMMFGGIMEKTGQLEVIVNKLLKMVKTTGGLVSMTIATCLGSNTTMPEQYISVVVPGRMYATAYKQRGLHPKMLSNALESGGTITSPLVPWNTCGVFLFGVLGVQTIQYIPYAIFNYSLPVVVIIMTYMGWLTAKIDPVPATTTEEMAIAGVEQ